MAKKEIKLDKAQEIIAHPRAVPAIIQVALVPSGDQENATAPYVRLTCALGDYVGETFTMTKRKSDQILTDDNPALAAIVEKFRNDVVAIFATRATLKGTLENEPSAV